MRDARHQAAGAEVGEEPVGKPDDADHDADGGVERVVHGRPEDGDEQYELEQHERRANAIRANLLLQAHDRLTATGARSASSSMRKNSRSRKPPRRAMMFVGTLWMSELKRRTVVL